MTRAWKVAEGQIAKGTRAKSAADLETESIVASTTERCQRQLSTLADMSSGSREGREPQRQWNQLSKVPFDNGAESGKTIPQEAWTDEMGSQPSQASCATMNMDGGDSSSALDGVLGRKDTVLILEMTFSEVPLLLDDQPVLDPGVFGKQDISVGEPESARRIWEDQLGTTTDQSFIIQIPAPRRLDPRLGREESLC